MSLKVLFIDEKHFSDETGPFFLLKGNIYEILKGCTISRDLGKILSGPGVRDQVTMYENSPSTLMSSNHNFEHKPRDIEVTSTQ